MLFFDPIYFLFVGPAILFSVYASFKVKSTFGKFGKVQTRRGITGAQTAQLILQKNGIHDVTVEPTQGFLSDHYDPSKKILRLSPEIFQGSTISAVGVAAHEVGHAIQHANAYAPLAFRSALVPAQAIGSNLAWLFLIGGVVFRPLALVGVILFSVSVLFTLVTLPVEFNASSRAMVQIAELDVLNEEEQRGARKVLSAAAMTYVAAAITAILTLLYFLYRTGILGGGSDD